MFAKIKRKFKTWTTIPLSDKLFLLRALLESAKNEILLKLKIYKPIKSLHFNDKIKDARKITSEEMIHLKRVSRTMKLLEKNAPWKPMCYNRALTAKKLLNEKNIKTNLHIGFRKKDGEFDGHAWITYRGKFVTGFLPTIRSFNELKPVDRLG